MESSTQSPGKSPEAKPKKRQSTPISGESPSPKKQKTDDDDDGGYKFDITLSNWFSAEVVIPIIRRNPDQCFKSINLVKDEIKKPIRDLVSIFFDLCESNLCCDATKTLVEGNVGLLRGRIVLREIHTESHTEAKCDDNFRELRQFIRNTFFQGFEKDLPKDMVEWLSLLKGACGCRELVNDHLALMNERARRNFIVQWSDITPQLNLQQFNDYLYACSQLTTCYDWDTKVTNIYALQNVFIKGQRDNAYKPNRRTNQTRFFRNFLVHFLDFCRPGRRQLRENLYFEYDDGLDILLSVFEDEIAMFPYLLYKYNLLEIFKPRKFF